MWIWAALAGLVIILSNLFTQQEASLADADASFYADQAAAMQGYRDMMGAFVKKSPGLEGAIDDSAAGIPAWFTKPNGLTAIASGGVAYIYLPAPAADLYPALVTFTNGSSQIGVATGSGTLKQAHLSIAPSVTIPSSIPANSVVYVARTAN